MIFLTYKQNSSGRSGHVLCDIFTAFVFEALIDIKILYNDSWKNQLILTPSILKKHTYSFNGSIDFVFEINNICKWDCLTFDDVKQIKEQINQLVKENKDKNVLVELSNVAKIHPHIVHHWYQQKKIPEDIYNNRILPKLREIYFEDHDENITDSISIHVRAGDLYHSIKNDIGFTFDYYNNIVDTLNKHFDTPINIFCEDSNSHDIKRLKNKKNVFIHIGGVSDFSSHFNKMINSRVLILSPSSMSLFAGYICKGLVLIDNKSIEWRLNVFGNNNLIQKFDNLNEKIEIIKINLQ